MGVQGEGGNMVNGSDKLSAQVAVLGSLLIEPQAGRGGHDQDPGRGLPDAKIPHGVAGNPGLVPGRKAH